MRSRNLLTKEFPIALDHVMTRIASLVILLGAAIIQFAGWPILGWVIVALGIMALWSAHLFAVAPLYDEPTDITDRADW
jgi:hypothetical protein